MLALMNAAMAGLARVGAVRSHEREIGHDERFRRTVDVQRQRRQPHDGLAPVVRPVGALEAAEDAHPIGLRERDVFAVRASADVDARLRARGANRLGDGLEGVRLGPGVGVVAVGRVDEDADAVVDASGARRDVGGEITSHGDDDVPARFEHVDRTRIAAIGLTAVVTGAAH